jgi:hypothetical protein
MVEFYLRVFEFDEDALSIVFYTGKTPLNVPDDLPRNVLVIPKRPNLATVIPTVISCVEDNVNLPPDLLTTSTRYRERMAKIIGGVDKSATPLVKIDQVSGL